MQSWSLSINIEVMEQIKSYQISARLNLLRKINAIAFSHVLPAAFWLFLAAAKVPNILGREPLKAAHSAVSITFILLICVLFIIRNPARGKRSSPFGALLALAGTFSPTPITLLPLSTNSTLLGSGIIITIIGLVLSIISASYLGRCFGIFPEVRGMVTQGPYRFVRHPLYFSEILSTLGLTVSALSIYSVLIFLTIVFLQLWRARYEERALKEVFPEYNDYSRETKQIFPFVW